MIYNSRPEFNVLWKGTLSGGSYSLIPGRPILKQGIILKQKTHQRNETGWLGLIEFAHVQ